jgi:hypothetical protein
MELRETIIVPVYSLFISENNDLKLSSRAAGFKSGVRFDVIASFHNAESSDGVDSAAA